MVQAGSTGVFIAVEGIDGAGKTTLSKALVAAFVAQGFSAAWTREPTEGPYGQAIRKLAAGAREATSAADELHLFIEDRREHMGWFNTALATHDLVVTDRYFFSTAAYQGARGLDPEAIYAAHEGWALIPALTIVVDVSPQTGLARVRHGRGEIPNAFEREEPLAVSRGIFLNIPGRFPHIVLDGERPANEVLAAASLAVAPLLGSPRSGA
jgi:dTMP kinase